MPRPPCSAATTAAAALVALVVAAVVVALKTAESVSPPTSPDIGDLVASFYPLLRQVFGELRHGELPLWDPHQSCGEPLLANPALGFVYPLYAPFLGLDSLTALRLDVALHLALSTIAMWALCRELGLTWGAGLLGGLVYAYCGSMLIKLNYPGFLAAVAWIPLVFLFVHRILSDGRRRDAGWLALVVGLMLLGGYPQFAYFTLWALLPFVAVQALVRARLAGSAAVARRLAILALAFGLGAAAAMVRLVPAAEFMRDTWRPPGSLDIASSGVMAIPPGRFLPFVLVPLGQATRFTHAASQAYVGIVPLGLAFAGLIGWRRRAAAVAVAVAGIAAVLYAFGPHAFLFPLLFALPGGGWFRAPDRALIIFGFAIALLSAAGADPLLAKADAAGWRARRWLAPACVAAAGVLAVVIGQPAELGAALLAGASGLGLLAVLAAAERRPRLRTGAALLLGLLIAVDLVRTQRHFQMLPRDTRAYFARNDDFFATIRSRQGLDRTYIWAGASLDSRLYFFSDVAGAGLYHGIWSPTSYAGGIAGQRLERYLGLLGPAAPLPFGYLAFTLSAANVQALDLMGVRFLLLEEGRAASVMTPEVLARLREIQRAHGLVLYDNPQVFPRAFLAARVDVETDPQRLLERLLHTDLRAVALLEAPLEEPLPDVPPVAQAPAAAVEITDYAANHVTMTATTAQAGLLVLTDQYRTGWRASVDGVPAPIHRADYLFRGVRVPAGTHRIEMRYRPASFTIGAAGSAAALVAIALLLVGGRPRLRVRAGGA